MSEDGKLPRQDRRMLKAAFTLALFGLLRVGEFTAQSQSGSSLGRQLRAKDVKLSGDGVVIQLRKSKTDQLDRGCKVCVGVTGGPCCPVQSLMEYMQHSRSHTLERALFQFQAGSPLTRSAFTTFLHRYLQDHQVNTQGYSSHSFRIGGATAAVAAGLPAW